MSMAITSSLDNGGCADGRGVGPTVGLGCGEIAGVGVFAGEICGVGVALIARLSPDASLLIQNRYPKVAPNKANNMKASAGFQYRRGAELIRRWRHRRHRQRRARSKAVSR